MTPAWSAMSVLVLLGTTLQVNGAVQLPSWFGDNMVLQWNSEYGTFFNLCSTPPLRTAAPFVHTHSNVQAAQHSTHTSNTSARRTAAPFVHTHSNVQAATAQHTLQIHLGSEPPPLSRTPTLMCTGARAFLNGLASPGEAVTISIDAAPDATPVVTSSTFNTVAKADGTWVVEMLNQHLCECG